MCYNDYRKLKVKEKEKRTMKTTMRMMDAAKSYLDQNGPQYKIEKPASVWLSMETRNANPNATWQAHDALSLIHI